jgi:UPF0716 protein FxsA
MIGYLVVLLLALPFVDMVLLFELSQRFGFLRVLAVVLATGVVGAYLVRREGRSVLEKLQTSVTAKEVSRNVLEGGVLLLGAIFLLTPGLLSDVLGVLCVLRPSRERLTVYVAEKLEKSASTSFEVRTF